LDVTAAQLSQLSYQSGSGTDVVAVRASDGMQWSNWALFNVNAPLDHAPVVTSGNVMTVPGQTFAASSLFTAKDADSDALTKCELVNVGTGGRHFVLNGVAQSAGQAFDVTAAQLAQLSYQSGSGSDFIGVKAYDGIAWSDWSVFSVTGGPATVA